MMQHSINSMQLALEALLEADVMREDKQNQVKRTAAITALQSSLASLQKIPVLTVKANKIEFLRTVQCTAKVNLDCNIPDSRSLHVQLDDEPLVDEQKRYFWRYGWNAYRDALHDALVDHQIKAELSANGWLPG